MAPSSYYPYHPYHQHSSASQLPFLPVAPDNHSAGGASPGGAGTGPAAGGWYLPAEPPGRVHGAGAGTGRASHPGSYPGGAGAVPGGPARSASMAPAAGAGAPPPGELLLPGGGAGASPSQSPRRGDDAAGAVQGQAQRRSGGGGTGGGAGAAAAGGWRSVGVRGSTSGGGGGSASPTAELLLESPGPSLMPQLTLAPVSDGNGSAAALLQGERSSASQVVGALAAGLGPLAEDSSVVLMAGNQLGGAGSSKVSAVQGGPKEIDPGAPARHAC